MTDNLASVADLETLMRVGPGSLQDDSRAAAEQAIAFASAAVRFYGDSLWGLDVEHPVPVMASMITAECARRRFTNPTGYTLETKGPFTYQRTEEMANLYLTSEEISILQGLAYGQPRPNYAGSIRTPSPWEVPSAETMDILLEFDL